MKSTEYGRTIATAVAGIFALTMSATTMAVSDIDPASVGVTEAAAASAKPDAAAAKANLQSVQQKIQIVNRFADRYKGDAAAQFGASFNLVDWKRQFGAQLMQQPASALASAMTARDLSTAQSELARAAAIAPKHSSDTGNVINMLPNPCRIVDTRFGGGGQLGPVFRYWAATDAPAVIAAQGGAAAGCGLFPNANLFFVYVTVVPAGAPLSGGANFLTLQHDNTGPTTSTMNFYPGINNAEFAAVACQGCSGGTGGFFAWASATTHVIVDLVGWGGTIAPAALQTFNQTGSVDIVNASSGGVCSGTCPAGYTLTGGGCSWGAGFNGNGKVITETGDSRQPGGWCCQADNNAGATRTLFAKAYCARTPGS